MPEEPDRKTVELRRDEVREIMQRLARGMRHDLEDLTDDPLPGPLLQALSRLERVEREHGERSGQPM